jgi:hypothetical protein
MSLNTVSPDSEEINALLKGHICWAIFLAIDCRRWG